MQTGKYGSTLRRKQVIALQSTNQVKMTRHETELVAPELFFNNNWKYLQTTSQIFHP